MKTEMFFKKLVITQLTNKIPCLYATWNFVTLFMKVLALSWATGAQYPP